MWESMNGINKYLKRFFSLGLALVLVTGIVSASATSAFAKTSSGTAAKSLEVRVMYTDDDDYNSLKKFDLNYFYENSAEISYTFVDSMPAVVMDDASGVYLSTILDDCNLKTKNVSSITFCASDGESTISASDLFDKKLYSYPELENNELWKAENGAVTILNVEEASKGMKSVKPMLAWQDDWYRVSAGPAGASESDRFRLLFGMEDFSNRQDGYNVVPNAPNTVKWVYRLDINMSAKKPTSSSSDGKVTTGPDDNPKGTDGSATSSGINQKPIEHNIMDVKGHWAEESIAKMVEIGAVAGNPDGSFRPNSEVTRSQFVSMLMKTMVVNGMVKLNSFKSIPDAEDHWAKPYLSAAIDAGILNPQTDGSVNPDRLITREEVASMLTRALKLEGDSSKLTVTDKGQISSWAGASVQALVENGGITGFPDGSFQPKGNATKAQAAVTILRTFTNSGYPM